MKTEDILIVKAAYNKCLKELTPTERFLLIEMLDEAITIGFNEGYQEAMYEVENL